MNDIDYAALFGIPAIEARSFIDSLNEQDALARRIAKIKADKIRELGIRPTYDLDEFSAICKVRRGKSNEQLRKELQDLEQDQDLLN